MIDRMACSADRDRLRGASGVVLLEHDLSDKELTARCASTARGHPHGSADACLPLVHRRADLRAGQRRPRRARKLAATMVPSLNSCTCRPTRCTATSTSTTRGAPRRTRGADQPVRGHEGRAEHMVHSFAHSYKASGGHPLQQCLRRRPVSRKAYTEFGHLLDGERCPVHADTLRSFVHADDVARAVALVAAAGDVGETYNIGTDNELSVLEVHSRLVALVRGEEADPADWMEQVDDRPYNDTRYAVRDDKMRALGWREEIDFTHGLREAVREIVRRRSGKLRWLVYGARGGLIATARAARARGDEVVAPPADDDEPCARSRQRAA